MLANRCISLPFHWVRRRRTLEFADKLIVPRIVRGLPDKRRRTSVRCGIPSSPDCYPARHIPAETARQYGQG